MCCRKKQRKNIQKEVIKNDNHAQKNINNIICPGDEYLTGGKRVDLDASPYLCALREGLDGTKGGSSV